MSDFFTYLDADIFFKKHWGKSYYTFKTDFQRPDSEQIIKNVLSSDIQYPDFRIVQRGGSVTPYLYTDSDNNSLSNKINSEKLKTLDLAGKTIKITGLERYIEEARLLAIEISEYFQGIDISVNGYFSKENAFGGSSHYDFYHIFVFQISGEKKWNIGNIVEDNPHKNFGHQVIENTEFLDSIITTPGDVLYLPPGIWHDVSTEAHSVHFAIGIQTPRIFNLLQQAITHISKNSAFFRSDLPLKYNNGLNRVELADSEINEILSTIKRFLHRNDDDEKFL